MQEPGPNPEVFALPLAWQSWEGKRPSLDTGLRGALRCNLLEADMPFSLHVELSAFGDRDGLLFAILALEGPRILFSFVLPSQDIFLLYPCCLIIRCFLLF